MVFFHELKIYLFITTFYLTCSPKVNNPYGNLNRTHKVNYLVNPNLSSTSWENRVFNLREEYADYAQKLNQLEELEEVPKPIPKEELERFQKEFFKIANSEMEIIKQIKNHYIHGIYLCKNLGSTGLSGFIKQGDQLIGGFIFLDVELLQNANEWITYKENTVFSLENLSLKIQIERDKENLLHNGIDYILLHELGHIIAVVEGFVPRLDVDFRDFKKAEFTKYDWQEETKSFHDLKIPKRAEIKFYSKPKLIDGDVLPIYTALEETPFPTLYAVTNADDHFAESFVSYVHVFLKKKPWILTIAKDKNVIYEMENGITKERCKREREFIENFLKKKFTTL